MTDLYSVSSCSPPQTDTTAPKSLVSTSFFFRIRTAPVNSNKHGRWIKSCEFSTLEAANQAVDRAAKELALKMRCRIELEVLAVNELSW